MCNTALKIYYLANKNEEKAENKAKNFCNLAKIKELSNFFMIPKKVGAKCQK